MVESVTLLDAVLKEETVTQGVVADTVFNLVRETGSEEYKNNWSTFPRGRFMAE